MKKYLSILGIILVSGVTLAACSTDSSSTSKSSDEIEKVSSNSSSEKLESNTSELNKTLGKQLGDILSATNWQGTRVYDSDGNDLTEENTEFIGLAKYDSDLGFYEFYDKNTGETRGDEGTFFITNNGEKRILISQTNNYQAIVDITELNEDMFTYKRTGKDKNGNEIEVFVDHIPYNEQQLEFTNGRKAMTEETGTIEKSEPGSKLLGSMLWNGTKVYDKDGNDLTEENKMFISLAKFEDSTSKYEFFDLANGETRGDYGYYDVIDHNKIRTHVSIGENKYGAVLEITELNDKKFTYQRTGKDQEGNEVMVFVEHEPYSGTFDPNFTF